MATRFYFPSSGTPAVSPAFDAAWEQTGSATRIVLPRKNTLSVLTAQTNSAAITIPITTTQQVLAYQFVSEVFLPQAVGGTVSIVIRCSENANSNNAFLAYVLRAVSADGGMVLGTFGSSMTNAGTEYALTASSATRIFTAAALSTVVCQQQWRLVMEVGTHAQAPTAAGSFIQRLGTSGGSDFALTSALTTDLNPWMELSADVNAHNLNNYFSVRSESSVNIGQ
jgi:hypothetical protein